MTVTLASSVLPAGTGISPWFLVFALLLGSACNGSDEIEWIQFNAEDDTVTIQVGVDEVQDTVSTVLHSTSGQVEVGVASVDPGGGPIGTEHFVVVEVYDDYEDTVGRATVRTDSGDRGEDEYEMDPDSADEGIYTTTLISVGDDGEHRSDILTFRLWYDSSLDSQDSG